MKKMLDLFMLRMAVLVQYTNAVATIALLFAVLIIGLSCMSYFFLNGIRTEMQVLLWTYIPAVLFGFIMLLYHTGLHICIDDSFYIGNIKKSRNEDAMHGSLVLSGIILVIYSLIWYLIVYDSLIVIFHTVGIISTYITVTVLGYVFGEPIADEFFFAENFTGFSQNKPNETPAL